MAKAKNFCRNLAKSTEYQALCSAFETGNQPGIQKATGSITEKVNEFGVQVLKNIFKSTTRHDYEILKAEDTEARLIKLMMLPRYMSQVQERVLEFRDAVHKQAERYIPQCYGLAGQSFFPEIKQ